MPRAMPPRIEAAEHGALVVDERQHHRLALAQEVGDAHRLAVLVEEGGAERDLGVQLLLDLHALERGRPLGVVLGARRGREARGGARWRWRWLASRALSAGHAGHGLVDGDVDDAGLAVDPAPGRGAAGPAAWRQSAGSTARPKRRCSTMPILFRPISEGGAAGPSGSISARVRVVAVADGEPAGHGEEDQRGGAHRQDARGADAIGLGPGGREVARGRSLLGLVVEGVGQVRVAGRQDGVAAQARRPPRRRRPRPRPGRR